MQAFPFLPSHSTILSALPPARARTVRLAGVATCDPQARKRRWQAKHGKAWYAKNAAARREYQREYLAKNYADRRAYLNAKQREYRAVASALRSKV